MKTVETKKMEQALMIDALRKNKHPALEVEFWHTEPYCIDNRGEPIFGRVGQVESIDAVVESSYMFTCLELKISMSDLHSTAVQSYVGNKNYLVCPIKMAKEIKQKNDSWLAKYPTVGIIGWDGKEKFKIIKRCKINYSIPKNDRETLAFGMLKSLSREMKRDLGVVNA